MQKTFFKKIIPSMLIVAILATGFFGAFRVGVVNAIVTRQNLDLIKDIDKLVGGTLVGGTTLWDLAGGTVVGWVEDIMTGVAMSITYVTGAILGISGVLFNHVIELTVTGFGKSLDRGVITEGWKIFRDLSNIIIIFALLVIGIATILRMENYGYKKLLGKLIAVAILINFSMFFTNIVIDSSNLLALQFYKTAQSTGKGSISNAYMQAFKLGTLYDIEKDTKIDKSFYTKDLKKMGLNWYQILIVGTLASIMFLIVTFAFFAVSLMFVVRYVALVFLIILSPLAFVGMILPKTQNLASKWWSNLFSYAIFAPVYLLLTWVTVKFINSSAFQQGIGLKNNMSFSETTKSGVEAIGNIPLFLNFAIVIALIIGSLILAKQMGGYGSSTIISWGQSAQKWGQGMVGGMVSAPFRYGARRGAESAKAYMGDKAHKFQKSSGGFARTLHKVPGVAYGVGKIEAIGRATVETSEDKYKNMSTEALKNIQKSFALPSADRTAINSMLMDREKGSPDGIIKYFKELPEYKRKEIFISMPAADQAKLIKNIKEEKKISDDGDEIKDLQNYLSEESKIKLRKEEKEVKVKEIERSIKAAIKKTPEEGKKEIKTIEEVIKDARKLKINFADLSAGILKHKDIATHITKEDIINIDVDGNLSKDDYTQFTKNIIEHGINEAKEQIRKSPIGKRFGGSKIVTENLETEFRNRNQK